MFAHSSTTPAAPKRPPAAAIARRGAAGLLLGAALSACVVGPEFHPPAPPPGATYLPPAAPGAATATQPVSALAAESPPLAWGAPAPAAWWTLFRNPALDALMARAIAGHPSLDAQLAAIMQAEQQLAAVRGEQLPSAGLSLGAERATLNQYGYAAGPLGNYVSNFYSGAVKINYLLDLFGGRQRSIEGYQANLDYQRNLLDAAALSLTTSLGTAAINSASLREQIAATDALVANEEAQLAQIARRNALGGVSRGEVLRQEAQVAATRATLPALRQQLALAEHLLAVLSNRAPADAEPSMLQLADFNLPAALPVQLPAAMVEQRPDIRAARAQLHQASAQIGVAAAKALPSFMVTASYGKSSGKFHELFSDTASGWSLLGGLTQPLFNGGALSAERRAAEAAYRQAAAEYRLTVLNALQNVADALSQLDGDGDAVRLSAEQLRVAQASLDFTGKRYAAGAVDFNALLADQQTYQRARIDLIRASARRKVDIVALFKALGGGWLDIKSSTDGSIAYHGQ